ncbi:MAG: DUF4224 domain-containing protein [Trinickia sp.]
MADKNFMKQPLMIATQRNHHSTSCAASTSSVLMKSAMQKHAGHRAVVNRGSIYLSRLQLRELTGTPIRARQVLWLAQQGWPHVVDVHGRVLVARAFHDKQMGIPASAAMGSTPPPAPAPLNLGAV